MRKKRSWSSIFCVSNSVEEPKLCKRTSLDRQVCNALLFLHKLYIWNSLWLNVFIWPHNISIFTCVNAFYHYSWVKEQEPINFSPRESSRVLRHIGRLKSSFIFGHMFFISFLDLLMCPFLLHLTHRWKQIVIS